MILNYFGSIIKKKKKGQSTLFLRPSTSNMDILPCLYISLPGGCIIQHLSLCLFAIDCVFRYLKQNSQMYNNG